MTLRSTVVVFALALLIGSGDASRQRRQVEDLGDNYNVFVRALPNPPPAGYDGRLPLPMLAKQQAPVQAPQGQPYRPPLLPQLSEAPYVPASAKGGGGDPPETNQYRPPLLLPGPPPPRQQQVIYIGGQQYGGQLSPSPSEQQSVPQPAASVDTRHQSKSIGSVQPPAQVIQKAPASEIEFDKGQGATAKDKDAKDDEYVVYYYYYYDNDTSANNLTLNFDDIPNLEIYDDAKNPVGHKVKETTKDAEDKGVKVRTSAEPVNAIQRSFPESSQNGLTSSVPASTGQSVPQEEPSDSSVQKAEGGVITTPPSATAVSVSVSVSEGSQIPPISNIFRYGSNEVPRVPVTPIMPETPTEEPTPSTTTAMSDSPDTSTPVTEVAESDNVVAKRTEDTNDVEPETESKVEATEPPTTTEIPTTTEAPTTVAERGRRRPGSFSNANRKRFGGPNGITSSRPRPTARATSSTPVSTTSTSTPSSTTEAATTRRSGGFRSPSSSGSANRFRRPSIGGNRPRAPIGGSSRASTEKEETSKATTKADVTSTTSTTTTTTKSRFGSNSFRSKPSSTRSSSLSSRPSPQSSTTSVPRSRPSPVSRAPPPSILSNRGRTRGRPSFLRPRPGKEEEAKTDEEKVEETTIAETEEVTTLSSESEKTTTVEVVHEEPKEDEVPEEPEPSKAPSTTTEANRFAGLFRPRNRAGLGNRPRPNILRPQSR